MPFGFEDQLGSARAEHAHTSTWIVDTNRFLDRQLGRSVGGVVWRKTMEAGDSAQGPNGSDMAANGFRVQGSREADADGREWVRIRVGPDHRDKESHLYLPLVIGGCAVLFDAEPACAPGEAERGSVAPPGPLLAGNTQ